MKTQNYDHDGLLGCATPQANRTVEPELRRLLPLTVNLQMSRCVATGDPRARLLGYFRSLEITLASYGGMPLEAFGLACTASSYLLDEGEEQRHTDALAERFGYPVCTAAQAMHACLTHLGARRLLIGSPYPTWIHDACVSFWRRRGYTVIDDCSAVPAMQDPTAIYELDSQAVGDRLRRKLGSLRAGAQADALLLTGTGLPSLALRPVLQEAFAMPVVSANVCMAWYLLHLARPGSAATGRLERELAHAPAGA